MRMKPGLPVLWRNVDSVQIGVVNPVVLSGLRRNEAEFVTRLEGRTTRVTPRERAEFDEVLAQLSGAPVWDTPSHPSPQPVVRVRGACALGSAVAEVLARLGTVTLSVVDPREFDARDSAHSPRTPPGGTRASAALRGARDAAPESHFTQEFAPAALEVVVGHGAPSLEVTRALMASDTPHLLVTADEGGVNVGPLVVPGETACTQCGHLRRTERDEEWPEIAIQLSAPNRMREAALPWETMCHAAIVTGAMVTDALGTEAEATLGARGQHKAPEVAAWRVEPSSVQPIALPGIAAHPDCGCGAAPSEAA